jgi:hypothetical protein
MPRPRYGVRRERVLITKEGWLLVQDDPMTHAVAEVSILIGKEERRFLYEVTTTEQDEHGRSKDVAVYREAGEGDG